MNEIVRNHVLIKRSTRFTCTTGLCHRSAELAGLCSGEVCTHTSSDGGSRQPLCAVCLVTCRECSLTLCGACHNETGCTQTHGLCVCDSCSLTDAENRDFPHTYCVVCGNGPFHLECLQGILCTVCATDDPPVPEKTAEVVVPEKTSAVVVPESTPEVAVPATTPAALVLKETPKQVVEEETEDGRGVRRSSRVAAAATKTKAKLKRKTPDSPTFAKPAPREPKKSARKVIELDDDSEETEQSDPDAEIELDDFTVGLQHLCEEWSTQRLHFQVTDGLPPGCILAFLPFASDRPH